MHTNKNKKPKKKYFNAFKVINTPLTFRELTPPVCGAEVWRTTRQPTRLTANRCRVAVKQTKCALKNICLRTMTMGDFTLIAAAKTFFGHLRASANFATPSASFASYRSSHLKIRAQNLIAKVKFYGCVFDRVRA